MTRYTSFDFRNSVLAIVATILVSTSSLFFAAGPIGQANAETVQTQAAGDQLGFVVKQADRGRGGAAGRCPRRREVLENRRWAPFPARPTVMRAIVYACGPRS